MNNSISLNQAIMSEMTQKAIQNKPVSWSNVERICCTFDDVLEVVSYGLSVGLSFSGVPSQKTENYLKNHGINLAQTK